MVSNTEMTVMTHQVALRVFQEALMVFAIWAQANLSHQPIEVDDAGGKAIAAAKQLVEWPDNEDINALQVVFDAIHLEQGQTETHYWPAWAINNTEEEDSRDPRKRYPQIPYPTKQPPALDQLQDEVKVALEALTEKDWSELPLLMLVLEKYGSYLSFGQPDVALFDQVKVTAAVATSLANHPTAEQLCLVAGDLSGIQDFIYTISSDGALKSLRARSFTLELVTEEIVQQLLNRLSLPRSNVIYAGGGNLYLLAPVEGVEEKVITVRNNFNTWLFEQYQSKVFLALDVKLFSKKDVGTPEFSKHWEAVIKKLAVQKSRKFEKQLERLLKRQEAHEPCKVCHRDDTKDLQPLGSDGVDACPTCRRMFNLGQQLFKVRSLVRSSTKNVDGTLGNSQNSDDPGYFEITAGDTPIYFHLFDKDKPIVKENEIVYLINNWDLKLYKFAQFKTPMSLLLGNYYETNSDGFITAQDMADRAKGIKRVGHLRMDVDKLGQIFAKGLDESYTLTRLSGLSRQMSYFFKVYLNSLAEFRERDFLLHQDHQNFQSLTPNPRQDLLFIYAGGDDLFVSGAWDQVVEFAFDVYQSFRAFTGWHPDITLSAGVSLSGPKYPLYQSAADSGKAEGEAKGNGRDSFTLFGETFKWQEWLGKTNQLPFDINTIPNELREYVKDNSELALFGIFPFLNLLKDTLGRQYSRSFVRNLLSTAQLQEQWIKKLKKERERAEKIKMTTMFFPDERDLRYFLHLPKIAYTLARLPDTVKKEKSFDAVRTSLKSPYNAPYFRAIATWIELLNRE